MLFRSRPLVCDASQTCPAARGVLTSAVVTFTCLGELVLGVCVRHFRANPDQRVKVGEPLATAEPETPFSPELRSLVRFPAHRRTQLSVRESSRGVVPMGFYIVDSVITPLPWYSLLPIVGFSFFLAAVVLYQRTEFYWLNDAIEDMAASFRQRCRGKSKRGDSVPWFNCRSDYAAPETVSAGPPVILRQGSATAASAATSLNAGNGPSVSPTGGLNGPACFELLKGSVHAPKPVFKEVTSVLDRGSTVMVR